MQCQKVTRKVFFMLLCGRESYVHVLLCVVRELIIRPISFGMDSGGGGILQQGILYIELGLCQGLGY